MLRNSLHMHDVFGIGCFSPALVSMRKYKMLRCPARQPETSSVQAIERSHQRAIWYATWGRRADLDWTSSSQPNTWGNSKIRSPPSCRPPDASLLCACPLPLRAGLVAVIRLLEVRCVLLVRHSFAWLLNAEI